MSAPRISIPQAELAAFCAKWRVREFALFGSVLRDDFRPDSDVDVLVDFEPDTPRTLLDLSAMRHELMTLLGRPVDLLTRRGVEESRNPYRRKSILESAEAIHVAG